MKRQASAATDRRYRRAGRADLSSRRERIFLSFRSRCSLRRWGDSAGYPARRAERQLNGILPKRAAATEYASFIRMARLVGRLVLAALFLFAGTVHLLKPEWFLPIMPPWIPQPLTGIVISGIAQIIGALGLRLPSR